MLGAFLQNAVGYALMALAGVAFLALLITQAPTVMTIGVPLAMMVGGSYLRFVARRTVRVRK